MMVGPQTRVPIEGSSAQSWSTGSPDAEAVDVQPRDPWLEADRPPLSLRKAFLFFLVTILAGFMVFSLVAWLMGF